MKYQSSSIQHNSFEIQIASEKNIKKWAERVLPNGSIVGQVTKDSTLHYTTKQPIRDGLFCERIFGPIADYKCACGKKPHQIQKQLIEKNSSTNQPIIYCPICEVEFTTSRVRRYRMGYIKLCSEVAHIWYIKGKVNCIAQALQLNPKLIDLIIFCNVELLDYHKLFGEGREVLNFASTLSRDRTDGFHLLESSNCFVVPAVSKTKRISNSFEIVLAKQFFTNLFILFQDWFFFLECLANPKKKKLSGLSSHEGFDLSIQNRNFDLFYQFVTYKTNQNFWVNSRGSPFHKTRWPLKASCGILSSRYFSSSVLKDKPKILFFKNKNQVTTEQRSCPFKAAPCVPRATSCTLNNCFLNSSNLLLFFFEEQPKKLRLILGSSFVCFQAPIVKKNNLYGNMQTFLLAQQQQKIKSLLKKKKLFCSHYLNKEDRQVFAYGPTNTSTILNNWLVLLLCFQNAQLASGCLETDSFTSSEKAKGTTKKSEKVLPKKQNRFSKRQLDTDEIFPSSKTLKTGAVLLYKFLDLLFLKIRQKINRFELVGFPKLKKLLNFLNNKMYEKLKKEPKISKTDRYFYNFRFKKYKKRVNRYLFLKSKISELEDLENGLPATSILSLIPVIPPDLRPIVELADGTEVSSDLNQLYQKVLIRNQRYQTTSGANALFSQRLLQEAVDNLIQNGKVGDGFKSKQGRVLKSLSDILKGKKGRFRQNLLGKRVDYSGRSVIVVGPKLKLHECGLPIEMAVELFQPFLVRTILLTTGISSVVGAKKLIKAGTPIIWDLLQKLMNDHPILLNRAPTLHRLGIQAFQAKLVSGRAILVHPLVCTAFNADFDGDQMGVHIPLSVEARTEAWSLLWARNNVLSPATGQPVLVPSQDMVLGCFYLTTHNPIKKYRPRGLFREFKQVCQSFLHNEIHTHTPIWVCYGYRTTMQNTNLVAASCPLEIRICFNGHSLELHKEKQTFFSFTGEQTMQVFRTTPGRIFFNRAIYFA